MYLKFIERNLRIYLKDKVGIFFSFLGMFISLIIYIFFLRTNLIDPLPTIAHADKFTDTWMVAGLISIVALTTPLNAFGQKMEDRKNHKLNDFKVNNDLKANSLNWLYTLTAIIEGAVSTIVFTILCFGYLSIRYNENAFNKEFVLTLLFNLLLITFSANFFALVTKYLRTMSSFSALSTILGTLAGFLSGTYIVYDALPNFMRNIVNFWPGYQIAAITRSEMMHEFTTTTPQNVLVALGVSSNIEKAILVVIGATIVSMVLNQLSRE